MFRTLLASLAVTAVDMVLVGTDRRHEMGPEDAEAAALAGSGRDMHRSPGATVMNGRST